MEANAVGITASKLALWRSAIAIAHADGKLSDKEKDLLIRSLPQRGLSDEQKQIIETDLAQGVNLETVFNGVTDMRDRAHLINFARQLINIDGKTDAAELEAIEYISQHHTEKLNNSVESVATQAKGRQLKSLYDRKHRRENIRDNPYLFSGDANFLDLFNFIDH